MLTSEQITLRSRAIHFFGSSEYANMVIAAQDYFIRNDYHIPVLGGVEAMPEFWQSIQLVMEDAIKTKK